MSPEEIFSQLSLWLVNFFSIFACVDPDPQHGFQT